MHRISETVLTGTTMFQDTKSAVSLAGVMHRRQSRLSPAFKHCQRSRYQQGKLVSFNVKVVLLNFIAKSQYFQIWYGFQNHITFEPDQLEARAHSYD